MLDRAPPPISGGTLLMLSDGVTAVASDPDRDRVWIARLDGTHATARVALEDGDEPGRLVEDDRGLVHVALRRGGAVVTIDPAAGAVVRREAACAAPRGIAFDAERAELVVACGGGELVTLPRDGGAARTARLDADLRDVVIWQHRRFVTRFRSAELVEVDAEGSVRGRSPVAPVVVVGQRLPMEPGVAWRALASPTLGVVMLHQAATASPLLTSSQGYQSGRGGCATAAVQAVVSGFGAPPAQSWSAVLPGAVLAVDAAVREDRSEVVVAAPGNRFQGEQILRYAFATASLTPQCPTAVFTTLVGDGQVVAVAFDGAGRVVYQTREPAGVHVVGGDSVTFADAPSVEAPSVEAPSVEDTGHALFHANAGLGLACASCHPEGGDDGRAWAFERIGRRRTPSVRGATSDTAPFHWDGDQRDMGHLLDDVFSRRMGGGALTPEQQRAVSHWVDGLPRLPSSPPDDAASAARGRALFESPDVGCAGCHAGPALTNNATVDVGTGGAFQVPSLRGLAWRAPYLHDGRAPTLRSRLMMGAGGQHGHTSQLDAPQTGDLLSYLGTL